MQTITMAGMFFESKAHLRSILTRAVKDKREKLGIMPQELTATCGLGMELPSCEQVEANPELMTGEFFSRVSFLLDLAVDDVLHVDLSDKKKMAIVLEQITSTNARVGAACGPGDIADISPEDLAPVYVVMKSLEEINTVG